MLQLYLLDFELHVFSPDHELYWSFIVFSGIVLGLFVFELCSSCTFCSGHEWAICDLQSDKDRLASSDDNGTIVVWNCSTNHLKQTVAIPGYK